MDSPGIFPRKEAKSPSGNRRQPPSRVRDQFQVNQGGLNGPMAQPPACVGSNVATCGQNSQLHRLSNRFLDPPPGCGPVGVDDRPAAYSNELQNRNQGVL